ncbi:MAG: hypothetical protein IJJ03_02285 [Mogibacterium sp.]|nr:hypothetical protein [Mogibacterium sp.]MBQ6500992.1 hypothetical protein [Mogibacterium sp.]
MIRKHSRLLSFLLVLSLVLSSFAFSATDTYAASFKRPKYIAHRGWSSKAPENTLAAFTLAAKNSNFYGVEFDIWESDAEKDEPLLLVMHDENIRRMCGVNKSIRDVTRKDLDNYTIVSGKNAGKYPGQKIPTADEALSTIWEYSNGAVPVIELKHRLSAKGLGHLFDLIGDHNVVIISFSYSAVRDAVKMARSRGISNNVQTMYLKSKLSSKKYKKMALKLKNAGITAISLRYTAVSRKTVKTFHKRGVKVCTWTLPNKKTARKYARMRVDYITANGAIY